MRKFIEAISIFGSLTLMSLLVGFLLGSHDGYDLGRKVGYAEGIIGKGGKCFYHNGRAE